MNPNSLTSCSIIPARLASTRLPGKLLLAAAGKPLIPHTCEAAQTARLPREVIVAADHINLAIPGSHRGPPDGTWQGRAGRPHIVDDVIDVELISAAATAATGHIDITAIANRR